MKPLTINGTPVSFERRRYGTQFYCWVYALLNDKWTCLGDPWPCSTPKHSEIEEAIRQERNASEIKKQNPGGNQDPFPKYSHPGD